MKNIFGKKLQKLLITIVLTCIPTLLLLAQCPDPTNPDCGGGDGGPGGPGVPLEGGVTLLLVMAACYVGFKVWQYRKMSKPSHSNN
ncbi:hypothetical protein BH11BAC5_BH11BAC5_19780 [soil metagenome]